MDAGPDEAETAGEGVEGPDLSSLIIPCHNFASVAQIDFLNSHFYQSWNASGSVKLPQTAPWSDGAVKVRAPMCPGGG